MKLLRCVFTAFWLLIHMTWYSFPRSSLHEDCTPHKTSLGIDVTIHLTVKDGEVGKILDPKKLIGTPNLAILQAHVFRAVSAQCKGD
jgi:hypothetical protein